MSRALVAVALVVLAAIAYVVVQVARPVPPVSAAAVPVHDGLSGSAPALGWPSQGEAAFGVVGDGVLASHGATAPTPLGSVTKIMTAYILLHDHPLATGQDGPEIPVTAADVTSYEADKAATDSVVAVQAGEQLTERQALEALLIPSGDNMAALLAAWDAGSVPAFVAKMNDEATTLGLANTHYADVSGVQPGSASTAADQVRLTMAAMSLPVFRVIVAMPQVTLPVAGIQYNVDALLGTDHILGVKTGYTGHAGGCFVFAATTTVGTATVTVVGAILHQTATPTQPSALQAAFDATTTLLPTIDRSLERGQVVRSGQVLATIEAPWSSPVSLRATTSVTVLGLAGEAASVKVDLPRHLAGSVTSGERIGTALVTVGAFHQHVPLVASAGIPPVSLRWRLTDV
ncbi:MAG: D-alanyl-D-alanine carboxypeptidase family protein [Acidimicrobiales bacterium]